MQELLTQRRCQVRQQPPSSFSDCWCVHGPQSVLLPPHHCPKSGVESNVILTYACPEKG